MYCLCSLICQNVPFVSDKTTSPLQIFIILIQFPETDPKFFLRIHVTQLYGILFPCDIGIQIHNVISFLICRVQRKKTFLLEQTTMKLFWLPPASAPANWSRKETEMIKQNDCSKFLLKLCRLQNLLFQN